VWADPDGAGIADGRLEIGSGRDKNAAGRHSAKLGQWHRRRRRISFSAAGLPSPNLVGTG
jgi:hypothetical protein